MGPLLDNQRRYFCDICGFRRIGMPESCQHCTAVICPKCWHSQAGGRGHEDAEHRHQINENQAARRG